MIQKQLNIWGKYLIFNFLQFLFLIREFTWLISTLGFLRKVAPFFGAEVSRLFGDKLQNYKIQQKNESGSPSKNNLVLMKVFLRHFKHRFAHSWVSLRLIIKVLMAPPSLGIAWVWRLREYKCGAQNITGTFANRVDFYYYFSEK